MVRLWYCEKDIGVNFQSFLARRAEPQKEGIYEGSYKWRTWVCLCLDFHRRNDAHNLDSVWFPCPTATTKSRMFIATITFYEAQPTHTHRMIIIIGFSLRALSRIHFTLQHCYYTAAAVCVNGGDALPSAPTNNSRTCRVVHTHTPNATLFLLFTLYSIVLLLHAFP